MTSMAVSARAASRPPPDDVFFVVDSEPSFTQFTSPAPKPPRGADVPVRPRPAELGRRRREPSSKHPPGIRRVPRLSRARGRLPVRTLPPPAEDSRPHRRPRRSVPPAARHAELRPGTVPAQLLVRHRRAERRGSRRRTRPTRGRLPRRARFSGFSGPTSPGGAGFRFGASPPGPGASTNGVAPIGSPPSPGRGGKEARPARPTMPVPSSPPFTAFVGNFPYECPREQVVGLFTANACAIADVRMVRNRDTDRPRGYFLEFEDKASLERALTFDQYNMGGRPRALQRRGGASRTGATGSAAAALRRPLQRTRPRARGFADRYNDATGGKPAEAGSFGRRRRRARATRRLAAARGGGGRGDKASFTGGGYHAPRGGGGDRGRRSFDRDRTRRRPRAGRSWSSSPGPPTRTRPLRRRLPRPATPPRPSPTPSDRPSPSIPPRRSRRRSARSRRRRTASTPRRASPRRARFPRPSPCPNPRRSPTPSASRSSWLPRRTPRSKPPTFSRC